MPIKSSYSSSVTGEGYKPVVFDILAPDGKTSFLGEYRMVLHINPAQMRISHQKIISRETTRGGFVEQHFGERPATISLEMVTGGFVHIGKNSANLLSPDQKAQSGGGYITNTGNQATPQEYGQKGFLVTPITRRNTIAYSKYLDMLALFKNNGAIYDSSGLIVFQGSIQIEFDGHKWEGWFQSFNVSESVEKPYMFNLNCEFTVKKSSVSWRVRG